MLRGARTIQGSTGTKRNGMRNPRAQWAARISRCAAENRFFLVCQPAVRLARAGLGETEYLEVLVRMVAENGAVMQPAEFIPAAERYGLMGVVDRWVVGRVLECLAQRSRSGADAPGRELCFAANISGTSLDDPSFIDFIAERFETTGATPASVCFEITETAAIANLDHAALFVRRLRDMGCRFGLDDFGSGLSSFPYLRKLPVDYVKIDGSIVRAIVGDPVDYAICDSIHKIARALGARTIAECVDSDAVLQRLRVIGVDCVQGFHIQDPQACPLLGACFTHPLSNEPGAARPS